MIDNTARLLVTVCKEASINMIKFIGRQYSFLTGIMDDLNVCFSFQVCYYYSVKMAFVRAH